MNKRILLKALPTTLILVVLAHFGWSQSDVTTFIHDETKVRDLSFSADSKFLIVKSGDEVITGRSRSRAFAECSCMGIRNQTQGQFDG
ncbi:MAG: hypothetical protein HC817_13145 [Saprospiraceae bacterium]|nr:hypothetical protein [Saprospiraceae bacterium]